MEFIASQLSRSMGGPATLDLCGLLLKVNPVAVFALVSPKHLFAPECCHRIEA
jgi:hypothetical protein